MTVYKGKAHFKADLTALKRALLREAVAQQKAKDDVSELGKRHDSDNRNGYDNP